MDQDHAKIRLVLSQVFVDTEIDYRAIAAQLGTADCRLLKEIFFEEVAPVCYPNLRAPVPPVWTIFDAQWLQAEIENRLARRRRSACAAIKDKILSGYLRLAFFEEWKRLEAELGHGYEK